MSCKICGRSSCTQSFHSLEEQERFEAREAMTDNVDHLRVEVQNANEEIATLQARAERAEAEVKRLRAALERLLFVLDNPDFDTDQVSIDYNAMTEEAAIAQARAALKENK